jgi:hypothetical protein
MLKLGASTLVALIAIALARAAIAELGELVHFNCCPDSCELTYEPLIGQLRTLKILRTHLVKSEVRATRLFLITESGEISLSESSNANEQLIVQREDIDRFISDPEMKSLSVRSHRPGVLWVLLVGIVGGAIATIYWIQT